MIFCQKENETVEKYICNNMLHLQGRNKNMWNYIGVMCQSIPAEMDMKMQSSFSIFNYYLSLVCIEK